MLQQLQRSQQSQTDLERRHANEREKAGTRERELQVWHGSPRLCKIASSSNCMVVTTCQRVLCTHATVG
jgi:hypothetical protein